MTEDNGDLGGGNWPSVELFETIGQQAVQAAGTRVADRVHILPIPGDNEQFIVVNKNGDYTFVRRHHPARSNTLLSVSDVSTFAKQWDTEYDDNGDGINAVIWVSPTAIIVTNNDDTLRNDRVTYRLANSTQFAALVALGKLDGYSQSEFLAFLRVDFARSFVNEEVRQALIRAVRSVRLQQDNRIGQGSGSFEANLASREDITWPDSIVLQLPVFDDPSISTVRQIEVILDVRPEDKAKPFKLTPVREDMTKATQLALAEAVAALKADVDHIPVYMGSP